MRFFEVFTYEIFQAQIIVAQHVQPFLGRLQQGDKQAGGIGRRKHLVQKPILDIHETVVDLPITPGVLLRELGNAGHRFIDVVVDDDARIIPKGMAGDIVL